MVRQRDGNRGDDASSPRGVRKDGKPYKDGNTRDDGSYLVGGCRPPPEHEFRKDDGRPRGRRPKGRKNLLTEWREELDALMPIIENGKRKKVSKRRALIKSKIKRGIDKSDRAAETALRYDELSEKRDPGIQADDREIIDAWFRGAREESDSDDADLTPGNPDDPNSDCPLAKEEGGDA